jgi:mRNA-degrading endonuclease RelE of RelBE toxin-antitoxin system
MSPEAHYGVAITEKASAFLDGLPPKLRRQIAAKVERLGVSQHPQGSRLIQESRDGAKRVYRLRSGKYRILYTIADEATVVIDIDHRKDVYR